VRALAGASHVLVAVSDHLGREEDAPLILIVKMAPVPGPDVKRIVFDVESLPQRRLGAIRLLSLRNVVLFCARHPTNRACRPARTGTKKQALGDLWSGPYILLRGRALCAAPARKQSLTECRGAWHKPPPMRTGLNTAGKETASGRRFFFERSKIRSVSLPRHHTTESGPGHGPMAGKYAFRTMRIDSNRSYRQIVA